MRRRSSAAIGGVVKGNAPPGTMLTTAITAAITAVLTWFGVPPGPYIAVVWVLVKVLVVAVVTFLGWRALRRRKASVTPPTPPGDA